MQLSRWFAFVVVAALAGAPTFSSAAVDATVSVLQIGPTVSVLHAGGNTSALHSSVHASATALHTGVHSRVHLHHGHLRHMRHVRAEWRAARTRTQVDQHSAPAPLLPRSRPARSHSALPHVGSKLHSSPSRGGVPYALGPASLSLALWTDADPMPVHRNESISNPLTRLLKGRGPPRGDPLSAWSCLRFARAHTFRRALPDPIRPFTLDRPRRPAVLDAGPRPAFAAVRSTGPRPAFAASNGGAADSPLVTHSVTPDRAFEGWPAGSFLPSRRCFT